MLLGIVLHGAISFIPGGGVFWGVQDSQASPLYGVLLSSIHGWRMPLFFLISGFFTAMLWKKRGLKALLIHRFKRIFLPLLLAMVTITPILWAVSGYVRSQASATQAGSSPTAAAQAGGSGINVWAAVATADQAGLKSYLQGGGDLLAKDPYGSTPLHVACLFGRADAAELLLEAGADLDVTNNDGKRPEDLLQLDWGTTAFIAQMVQVPVDQTELLAGREEIARAISEHSGRSVTATPRSDGQATDMNGLVTLLTAIPVFGHLWFLWFLCWYVCCFALIVRVLRVVKSPAVPDRLLTSHLRYAWLLLLAGIPQFFMASEQYAYGPDTSVGLLPLPAVFAYYAVFFGYGALYFGAGDDDVAIGQGYWWKLAIALLILFPVGLSMQGPESTGDRVMFSVLQVSYAWAMSFGMIGLFHRLMGSHRWWVRYLSDSSYWLYLVHIPLLMVIQFLVRDWPVPSFLKFILVCFTTTALLLLSYQLCVRNTWIGQLLNGRRYSGWRPESHAPAPADRPTELIPESAS